MIGDLIRLAFAGLAPGTVERLIERHGTPRRVVAAVASGRTRSTSRAVEAVRVGADDRLEELSRLGVAFVVRGQDGYPSRLRTFSDAPRWLFLLGDASDAPSIGIVGTRTCTSYGTDLAQRYGFIAAERGWSVVSGLARGIDGAGHQGAIAAQGHCHAVLGSGIDVVYPRSHRALYRSVVATGGVISSEFPPGTPPEAWRFPTRNRIIAGLSDVLLVVEAGEKGGALITAGIALEYGIPVFAVPGDVDRPASVGTNLLIRDGAFPILGPEDFGEVLDLLDPLYSAGRDRRDASTISNRDTP